MMILAGNVVRMSFVAVAAAIAMSGTLARADVMELDVDGARWVAGGNSVTSSPNMNTTGRIAGIVTTDAAGADGAGVIVPLDAVSSASATLPGVPPRYAAKVNELSQRYDLSPRLIEALVWQESRWRENAVSHAGARGLAQLMPGTAKYLGVNPDDPMQNLEGGARYLREQLNRFDGDLEKALAAYNAGPGRVIRAGGIPNIRETRHYVAAIMGRLASHSRPR